MVAAPWTKVTADGNTRYGIETFVKSRRIGGSVAAAYRAACWAAGLEIREDTDAVIREPIDVIVVSKDFRSAIKLLTKEIVEACEDLAPLNPNFRIRDSKQTRVTLANGRTIEAIPCSDKAIRGNTAGIICDEFAFWRQQEACWAAVKSVTDPNLKFPHGMPGLLVTTPWEAGSLAHRIFTEFPFRHHSTDIYQAVEAGFPIVPKEAFEELGIPELIDTEYLCKWTRGGDTFFPIDKLRDACRDDLPPDWVGYPVSYGIDCGGGRGRDFDACVQWRHVDDERWMVGVMAFNNLDIETKVDRFASWIRRAPGPVRIDRGVMGGDVISMLQNRLAGNKQVKISGVGMMMTDQEKYATTVKRFLERDRLRFYTGTEAGGDENGHRALMLELSQLKTKPGVGGHLSFATPRDTTHGHLDRAWASLIGLSGSSGGGSHGSRTRAHVNESPSPYDY